MMTSVVVYPEGMTAGEDGDELGLGEDVSVAKVMVDLMVEVRVDVVRWVSVLV